MTSPVPNTHQMGPVCGRGALHMGGAPRSTIQRSVPRLGTTWVLFPPLSERWLKFRPVIPEGVLAELDDRWAEVGFTGATSVVPVGPHDLDVDLGRDPEVVVCGDEALTANVRLRLRGRLLLADMPLIEQPEPLVGAASGVRGVERRIAAAGLLCGDPRLHALVVAGKHCPLGEPTNGLGYPRWRGRARRLPPFSELAARGPGPRGSDPGAMGPGAWGPGAMDPGTIGCPGPAEPTRCGSDL